MEGSIQIAVAMGVPTLAVLIGILINNSRLSDLRAHMDSRFTAVDGKFDTMEKLFTERLRRVEEVVDARLTRIESELKIR
ncbi:MAG: hypothetical protein GY953_46410 [bacterium]|nr:hypothetical protein [bacterium]